MSLTAVSKRFFAVAVLAFLSANVDIARATIPLFSQRALVVDAQSGKVLVSKSADQVVPIASITKLMSAMVVLDAKQNLAESVEVTVDDLDFEKGSKSRLNIGSELTRGQLLQLSLMSSENRAAHALGRAYPGGLPAMVRAMNQKARQIGLHHSKFADPTGLSPNNVSSARDLLKLVSAAEQYPMIKSYSTQPEQWLDVPNTGAHLHYVNSNALIKNPDWRINLQKTGYISEAGKCLVMSAVIAGRPVLMALLDSVGRYSRLGDAHRIRHWLETGEVLALPKPVVKKSKRAKNKGKAKGARRR